ncbi:M57 family metalloprotease [Roseivirga sp. BDSF3-8]|uniref:M57 family metalloprotease n=1 Tax=Roseivirga sp. BDSF3-8 TaxID=3241598 RepID=UPI003531C5A9
MKKFTYFVLYLVLGLALFTFSCTDDAEVTPSKSADGISAEIKDAFSDLGFDVSDIRKEMFTHPVTKKTELHYILENDIRFTYEQLLASIGDGNGPRAEQYRTTNLVSVPSGSTRTIKVLGYQNGSGDAGTLDASMVTGLQNAVANYNALGLGITFTLSFGNSTTGKDIVVCRQVGAGGGSAGFPTSGNPYHTVLINSGTTAYGLKVLEHVTTHEIGHCVGLRHTDYFNRSISCGSGGNEGDAGVGAIHIPGTPTTTNIDLASVMLACFDANETGEFSNYDKVALQALYPNTSVCGNSLAVSATSASFGSASGTRSITVTSNTSWSVSDNASWITVSPASGVNNGSFVITVAANNMLCEPRWGSVTVSGCGVASKTISITQAGKTPQPGQYCP